MISKIARNKTNFLIGRKFFKKMAVIQTIIVLLAIFFTSLIARFYLISHFQKDMAQDIFESLDLIKTSTEGITIQPQNWCQKLPTDTNTRYTLMNWDGDVLCDTAINPSKLSNHLDRPEVIDAKETGHGQARRLGKTTGIEMNYGTIVLPQSELSPPYILRKGIALKKLDSALDQLDQTILVLLIPIAILSTILILWISLKFSFPMQKLLRKVELLKGFYKDDSKEPRSQNEWAFIETTLDEVQEDLEKYLEALQLENKKFSTLVESIQESILAINSQHKVLYINQRFKNNFLSSYLQKQDVSKINIWSVFKTDMDIKAFFDQAFAQKQTVSAPANKIVIKEGQETCYFEVTVTPMQDSQGNIIGAVGLFHNETRRKLADQMRADFVANVSHEVRTPLTALKGYVQILKEICQHENKSTQDLLNRIEKNSDRLTNLFTDILNLSVIENNETVEKIEVNIEAVAQNCLTNIKYSHNDKKIHVEQHFMCPSILGDPSLIDQVLTNYVENAFKYTPQNGTIKIKTYEQNNLIVLEVENEGEPIPLEHHSRLFERFYRVDASRSREVGGTGLGLSIVKHIVNKHHGKVWVRNRSDGKGVSFFAAFPKIS